MTASQRSFFVLYSPKLSRLLLLRLWPALAGPPHTNRTSHWPDLAVGQLCAPSSPQHPPSNKTTTTTTTQQANSNTNKATTSQLIRVQANTSRKTANCAQFSRDKLHIATIGCNCFIILFKGWSVATLVWQSAVPSLIHFTNWEEKSTFCKTAASAVHFINFQSPGVPGIDNFFALTWCNTKMCMSWNLPINILHSTYLAAGPSVICKRSYVSRVTKLN